MHNPIFENPVLIAMENEFSDLTAELKDLSGTDSSYSTLWDARAELRRRIDALKSKLLLEADRQGDSTKEILITDLVNLWTEYTLSKSWWNPEDTAMPAFITWLTNGRPHSLGSPLNPKKENSN